MTDLTTLFSSIAAAIRNKTGSADKIKASDFPSAIDAKLSSTPVKMRSKGVSFLSLWVWLTAIIGILPHISVFILSISNYWFLTLLPTKVTPNHFLEVFYTKQSDA